MLYSVYSPSAVYTLYSIGTTVPVQHVLEM